MKCCRLAGWPLEACAVSRRPLEESPGSTETGCRVMPGEGAASPPSGGLVANLRESATESRPPCRGRFAFHRAPACVAEAANRHGKGERVRQERTAPLATAVARQAPPGARPNRGGGPKVRKRSGRACFRPLPPGLVARGAWRHASQMNGHPSGNLAGGQNPAYRSAGGPRPSRPAQGAWRASRFPPRSGPGVNGVSSRAGPISDTTC